VIVLHEGAAMRWLHWKPLVRLGILSYSVYLLHEPVMRLARYAGLLPEPGSNWGILATFLVVVVVTALLAMLTYPVIEQYGMKLLDMFGPDGRPKSYYEHAIDEPRPSRGPTMRIVWEPDGELVGARTANDRVK
jgi:peptidoglycan/LPS O-acetylase OafA/YrhL